jgi:hypothetical protein
VSKGDYDDAKNELLRLKFLARDDRIAALRKLPGVGHMAAELAHAIESIPADAMHTMLPHLDAAAIGSLTGTPSKRPGS